MSHEEDTEEGPFCNGCGVSLKGTGEGLRSILNYSPDLPPIELVLCRTCARVAKDGAIATLAWHRDKSRFEVVGKLDPSARTIRLYTDSMGEMNLTCEIGDEGLVYYRRARPLPWFAGTPNSESSQELLKKLRNKDG